MVGFLGFSISYAMRVNLSVAIVYMVNNTAISGEEASSDGQGDKDGPFVWDEAQQGIILGMFFYGYVVTQVRVVIQHFIFSQEKNCHIIRFREEEWQRLWEENGYLVWVMSYLFTFVRTSSIEMVFTLTSGLLITAVFTLLTPLAAKTDLYFLYAVRIIEVSF